MLSISSAYEALVEAAENSAQSLQPQTTTSLAPELGLREMGGGKHHRDYERHDGETTLHLIWRQTEHSENLRSERHVLTVTLTEGGVIIRRHSVEFDV